MKADVSIDTTGLFCPIPIVKTAQKMAELKSGQTLEVISDDEGIKSDMPAWCRTTGNEFLETVEEGGVFKVTVRKR